MYVSDCNKADFEQNHTFRTFSVLLWVCCVLFDPCDVISCQHQDREGEEGACKAAWDD